ncbi:extracellular solute-binding protein [Frigidibacter sp. ROC022]|uniref:extracellular solute-binding protein n=1 Tax=Frigidibacter sp. ROC022 TaxID=2971796 RepID=UPI00215A7DE3|nr:extracellular solute-binding protein [Frigidibacter sp. ROC022]MCR8725096.1 extracellular solute-binding protein [Frigidibacter sp. ROC022]
MKLKLAVAFAAATIFGPMASAQDGNLVIYNPAGDAGELVIDAFREKYPSINISAINAGVGELFTRMGAEKDNPQGDVILCASSEAFLSNPGLFEPYDSTELANFSEDVVAPDHSFYGCSMPLQAFIVNTNLLSEDQYPRTWEALADPMYKDKLVMANPSLSGSAYAQLAQMLQLYGWDMAEKVMDNARFVTSSQSVFQDVGRGEIEIGITGEVNVKTMMDDGFPVTIIYPEDGTGLRFDASGIIKGGPNPENAKLFLDFANSKEAHELVASTNRRSVRKDVAAPDGLAPTADIPTFPYDANKAAADRDENLAKFDALFNK